MTNLIIYLSFFLSGVSGLIYEVLWAKHLALFLGSTAYAHTLILTIFMAGLALGSLWLGGLADKIRNKTFLYFWMQFGIALCAQGSLYLLKNFGNIYLFGLSEPLVFALKITFSILTILPATILMGGTLPTLSKYMIRNLALSGEGVARLYYVNNLGALFGIFLAGFYLIGRYGIIRPIYLAASLNILAGFLVLCLREKQSEILTENQLQQSQPYPFTTKVIKIALLGIFISGITGMLYEVVWIRLLSLILGSSTYSFSLMLAAFILGITIGSVLISKFMPKDKFTFLAFGFCEIGIGLSLILSLPFYERLPFFFLKLSRLFVRTPENFIFYESSKFLLAILVMLIPTVFLGMTFPMVSKISTRRLEFLGKKIGNAFAFNSFGNIVGASLTGLALIPVLGLKHTLELGIIINLGLGILIIFFDVNFSKWKKVAVGMCVCLIFTGYKIIVPEWEKCFFTAQIFRFGQYGRNFKQFSESLKKEKKTIYYKDGMNATIAVTKRTDNVFSLYVNGKVDASNGEDMPTQILVAQIPLLLNPSTQDVFVLGLGSGVTCGSALLHDIKTLDLVEISPEVVEANKFFRPYNYDALANKRLHLYVEDAKTFLQRTDKKYDVIINEPSNPWMSGIGSLFSIEFFRECQKHLKPGGIMAQWVQAYEMDDSIFRIILRTISAVFPEVSVWSGAASDTIIIASNEKINVNFDDLEKKIAQQDIKDDLARIKVFDAFTLLALQVSTTGSFQDELKKGVKNSDYLPILEYMAPIALFTRSFVKDLLIGLDERLLPIKNSNLFMKDYLARHKIVEQDLINLYGFFKGKARYFNQNIVKSLAKRWYKDYPQNMDAFNAYISENVISTDSTILEFEKRLTQESTFNNLNAFAFFVLQRFINLRSFILPEILNDTVEKLKLCVRLSKDRKARFYFYLGQVYLKNRDYDEAISCFQQAEFLIQNVEKNEVKKTYSDLISYLSLVFYRKGDFPKALEYAEKAVSLGSDDPSVKWIISISQSKSNQ